ncbi:polyketide cyclase / dehydrase and lipid transport [Mumia zhuanghuii]|uniref:Polyketide cyclase / dehydrase and lipid transport n=2 Tax=Mumia TaxID=1546255 RepID=A0ABW1QLT5_9ACTN|nr:MULTISPECIES: polyketide cyclase / dehydrase and lipid transport [Mumia]KAA1423519.1 polyketide cyclase / dehydrase and lipid transport [Mumia zhuanghuii]
MPVVDVIDQTYVAVPPRQLLDAMCDESAWSTVLPGVRLRCFDDRGVLGRRWRVSGVLDGTAEVWLEEMAEGTVVHVFLQADPTDGSTSVRARRRAGPAYHARLKRWVTHVRDSLDVGRAVGDPPAGVGGPDAATPDVTTSRTAR